MVTKEQAINGRNFVMRYHDKNYRANGKCITWKTRPDDFKLPVKHGLYSYGYITHENAYLFDLVD